MPSDRRTSTRGRSSNPCSWESLESLCREDEASFGSASDLLLKERLRCLARFARLANRSKSSEVIERFNGGPTLVLAVQAAAHADDLLSAALLGDIPLYKHRMNGLLEFCAADPILAPVVAWRIRAMVASTPLEIHMQSSYRHRQLRRDLSDSIATFDRMTVW